MQKSQIHILYTAIALALSVSTARAADQDTFAFFAEASKNSDSRTLNQLSDRAKTYRWLDRCNQRIQYRMRTQKVSGPAREVELSVKLNSSDTTAVCTVLRTSGSADVDAAIMTTLKKCAPFERPTSNDPYNADMRVRFLRGESEMYICRAEPVRVNMFGSVLGTAMSGQPTKKQLEKARKERTLKGWCEINSKNMDWDKARIFKNTPASFLVTFEGKGKIGTLHPLAPAAHEANRAAIRAMELYLPLSNPPPEVPYERGLLLHFGSNKFTVSPAPEKRLKTLAAQSN